MQHSNQIIQVIFPHSLKLNELLHAYGIRLILYILYSTQRAPKSKAPNMEQKTRVTKLKVLIQQKTGIGNKMKSIDSTLGTVKCWLSFC